MKAAALLLAAALAGCGLNRAAEQAPTAAAERTDGDPMTTDGSMAAGSASVQGNPGNPSTEPDVGSGPAKP